MVTSNKSLDKKVVKMSEQNSSVVVPQRTLLGEVNEHITCPLCRGYYIDATTIVECLHSFCRSCIIKHLQVKSYCPVCEMMINSAKPNIKPDKALQDIVYKLVPGLFQKEMDRRQTFYASRPGPAACATPEQRGEDTERIIFSPEDVISFSLEYADATDTDSISSKSSDSNEPQPPATSRRYLQCPAVVNISHLKKFLSMKFDIDSTQFAVDILYKRVPLPDYYTLMDIAYIYNWKRNEPMRFFYQIIDYVAIRNRIFDVNRKGSHFRDRKSSPATTEETNASSPAPNITDQGSEASSGTDSPMPDDSSSKVIQKLDKPSSGMQDRSSSNKSSTKKGDDEVEKSQFLNSFELKAKSDLASSKCSPTKEKSNENISVSSASQSNTTQQEDSLKRKQSPPSVPDMKKLKVEIEKSKLSDLSAKTSSTTEQLVKTKSPEKPKDSDKTLKSAPITSANKPSPMIPAPPKDIKHLHPTFKKQAPDSPKRPAPASQSQSVPSPKLKKPSESNSSTQVSSPQRTVTPLKLHLPKPETPASSGTPKPDTPKPTLKKMPDLKPTNPPSSQIKNQPVNKLRMDLLANNSDPTIDRSKILSQVKSSLGVLSPGHTSGDPLKSLFDSCKINIPSSLSITLTDQKQDSRNPAETAVTEPKKPVVNKNLSNASNSSPSAHKVPSPPVHNYIEILKLPDSDPRKQVTPDGTPDSKQTTPSKPEGLPTPPKPAKSSETSAKGPIPNLKPISDTKLAKQAVQAAASANAGGPITFQQTFEQQLQSLQTDKKPKLPKTKAQVPKLVPATPKAFSAAKLNSPTTNNKPNPAGIISALESKASAALDLSTPHPLQTQLSPHQTKAFETMQSIANLAKKQNLPPKGSQSVSQTYSSSTARSLTPGANPIRIPSANVSQIKPDKINPAAGSNLRQDLGIKSNPSKSIPSGNSQSPSYPTTAHSSQSTPQPQPSPRQTRSPSSSPKLVIAEEKQVGIPMEHNVNQSNQITSSSSQLPSSTAPKNDSPKASPGPSKPTLKPIKPPVPAANKIIPPPTIPKPNPPTDFQLMSAHQALLRHQMEMSAWIKAQRQFDLYKNMTSMAHQTQNDFNKDKQ